MKQIYRWSILSVLIVVAISFYSYGSSTGMFIFILLGFLVEIAFWLKLFDRGHKKLKNKTKN